MAHIICICIYLFAIKSASVVPAKVRVRLTNMADYNLFKIVAKDEWPPATELYAIRGSLCDSQ